MKKIPRFMFDLAGETPNRDELRTPMQWNDSTNAGFSQAGKTWLPVNDDYKVVNVLAESVDKTSLLESARKLLLLRRGNMAFQKGGITILYTKSVLVYKRALNGQSFTVVINFSNRKQKINLQQSDLKTVFNTSGSIKLSGTELELAPLQGLILTE
jgi:glycosidase